jgi:heme/copper-type cytochrome/quinol oxidase subunit 1
LTRWHLKAGLFYFVVALITGILTAARPVINLPPAFASLTPVYFHLLMVGWVTQAIFGVAYWMFPKFSRDQPRRSETQARATFVLLNLGLILRVIGEPMQAFGAQSIWGWLLALSAVLQWLAGLLFVVNIWARVKER